MAAIPYISVQPNYAEVFSDVASSTVAGEKVWLSYYSSNAPSSSVHVKLPLVQAKEEASDRETQGGVRIGEIETSGGPANALHVQRVQGSWLDLHLSHDATTSKRANGDTRSARTLQPEIELDAGVQVRFARKTLTQFLPTVGTSKVNDNYTNHPTIDAFDLSLGSADDERDLFVAGGAEGSLYTGRLAADFDAAEARAAALETLTDEERHLVGGEAPDPEAKRWEIEARLRLHVNTAKSKHGKKTALKGHVGDIRFAQFFPSNRVVLSTSSDLTCRIWDPFTGDNPRTLEGHKRAVLSAGVIGRGRTLLTAGADGSVRLWDVAAPKQLRLMGSDRYSAVHCLSMDRPGAGGDEAEQSSFVVGLASGAWQLFDLRTARAEATVSRFAFPPGEPPSATDLWTQSWTAGVSAIDVQDTTVITGTTNGIVAVWDRRMLSSSSSSLPPPSSTNGGGSSTAPPHGLVTAWRRNNAEIRWLKLVASGTGAAAMDVLVATQDGLPYRAALQADRGAHDAWHGWAPSVVHEYAGWDCDQTSWIGLDRNGTTVIAGAEGAVRRY